MNAVLRKEIRLLMPAWIVAIGTAILPEWVMGEDALMTHTRWNGGFEEMSLFFFVAGALLLSLASFGSEMSYGTFGSLLAQPRARLKTWRMKIGLLALALILVMAAEVLSWWVWRLPIWDVYVGERWGLLKFLGYCGWLALIAFMGGLWTTLLCRQVMTAFWFAIIVPLILYNIADTWFVFNLSPVKSFGIVTGGYAAVGYWLARWLFLHAQDMPEREATDVLTWSFLPAFRGRRRPVVALLVKELRLQQGTLVIAVALVLLHLVSVAVWAYLPPAATWNYPYLENTWMVWFLAPLLVSCGAVAEERRARTLESALCLPVAETWQFVIKLLVVFGLGIFLGAIMPWVLELLRPFEELNHTSIHDIGLPNLLIVAMILTGLGCYGSSLSSTLLQAFGMAIVLGLASLFGGEWAHEYSGLYWPSLIVAFVWLSYANFKHVRITGRQWLRNGTIWLLGIGVAKVLWFLAGGIPSFLSYYTRH